MKTFGLFQIFLVFLLQNDSNESAQDISSLQNIKDAITLDNWPAVYNRFCGRECVDGKLVSKQECEYPYCFPCTCDETCKVKGSCCPSSDWLSGNFMAENRNLSTSGQFEEMHDLFSRTRCSVFFRYLRNGMYRFVDTCPDKWENPIVRSKCEEWVTGDELEYILPYVDTSSSLVFKNVFCGQCNGFESDTNSKTDTSRSGGNGMNGSVPSILRPLWVGITCPEGYFNYIYHYTDRYQLLKFILLSWNDIFYCWVEPIDVFGSRCIIPPAAFHERNMYHDTCPDNSSQTLKELCHNLPYIPALRVDTAKNLFCYLCNGLDIYPGRDCSLYFPESKHVVVYNFQDYPLNNAEEVANVGEDCWSHTLLDSEVGCISVSCSTGKLLLNGTQSCEAPIKEMKGMDYYLHFVFVTVTSVSLSASDAIHASLLSIFNKIEKNVQHYFSFETKDCHIQDGRPERQQQIKVMLTPMHNVDTNTSRDEFELQVLELIKQSLITHNVYSTSNVTEEITLRLVCIGEELCEVYRTESGFDSCEAVNTKEFGPEYFRTFEKNQYIEVTSTLVCPSVSLQLISNPTVENGNLVLPIQVIDWEVNITDVAGVSMHDGKFRMCLSGFEDIVRQQMVGPVAELKNDSASGMVTVKTYVCHIYGVITCILLLSSAL